MNTPPARPSRADRVEAAAQLLHEQRHRLGSGQVCDRCRALARRVAAVLTGARPEQGPVIT